MSDYLLIVREDEIAHGSQPAPAIAELIAQRAQFADSLRATGRLKDHGRFRPSREAKRVSSGGVEDGPFADEGKALAAYYWIDAPDVEEATRLAAELPGLPSDEIDVRPLMKGAADANMQAKPGKIFAFAVLGNAESEPAWSEVM